MCDVKRARENDNDGVIPRLNISNDISVAAARMDGFYRGSLFGRASLGLIVALLS